MDNQQIRLNKFLAERIGVSRREADDLIAAGRVTIDGKVAKLGDRVTPTGDASAWASDRITPTGDASAGGPPRQRARGKALAAGPVGQTVIRLDGKIVPFATEYTYLAFNKPVGYVCSRRAQGSAPTLYELLPKEYKHLKTVGRLDKDSSGLILLTNDGDFAFEMTHPKFHKEKVYEVELDRPLEPLHQQMISDYGVMLEDGPSKFTVIKDAQAVSYTVILSEGRNRQIRRTFAALGYKVVKLHRTTFGKYSLSGLKPGEYVIFKV